MGPEHFIIIGLLILILLVLVWQGNEYLSNPIYLDQIATNFVDPTLFAYEGDQRDILGMSSRDYYLQNSMDYANGAAPGYFANSQLYVNQQGYLDMPQKYRKIAPSTMTAPMLLADQLAKQAEASANQNVANGGSY